MSDLLLTAPGPRVPIPHWIRSFSPRTANQSQLRRLKSLPELTVVRMKSLGQATTHSGYFSLLAKLATKSTQPARILLAFDNSAQIKGWEPLATLFELFPTPAYLDVARADASLAILEALAKNEVSRAHQAKLPSAAVAADPLGEVKSMVAATAELRAPSGRLSAARVAEAFGLSSAALARLAGKSRQAVQQYDDSPGLQEALQPFERIARLRARLSEAEFRRWLNLPNDEIEGQSPLEAIRAGHAPEIANWAENLLIGNPM